MKRLAIVFVGLVLGASPVAAQPAAAPAPPPMFSPADGAAATALVHRYFAAFTAKDYPVFRRVFNAPFLQTGRQITTIPTLDGVMQLYEGIRNPLDQADYSASKATEVRLIPLHVNSVLANVHWQRLKKDGSLLNEGAEVLVLVRVDGEWKISGVMGEDLRQFRAAR